MEGAPRSPVVARGRMAPPWAAAAGLQGSVPRTPPAPRGTPAPPSPSPCPRPRCAGREGPRGAQTGPYLVEAVVPLASAALVLRGRREGVGQAVGRAQRGESLSQRPALGPRGLQGTGLCRGRAEGGEGREGPGSAGPGFALPTQIRADTRCLGSRLRRWPHRLPLECMGLRTALGVPGRSPKLPGVAAPWGHGPRRQSLSELQVLCDRARGAMGARPGVGGDRPALPGARPRPSWCRAVPTPPGRRPVSGVLRAPGGEGQVNLRPRGHHVASAGRGWAGRRPTAGGQGRP